MSRLLLLLGLVLVSCRKDKVENPEPIQPTKWEVIAGDYKVYDTMGVFLHEMKIIHKRNDEMNQDSLVFVNFDGNFNFSAAQSNSTSNPLYYVSFGSHSLVLDSTGKRWKILTGFDMVFDNIVKNDTLLMSFEKTNINYYIEDLVPYFYCDCKQIAVKQ